MNVPGDPREHYIARMEWVSQPKGGGSKELVIQHLNRLQDTLQLMAADPQTGAVRTLFTEQDSTWVEQFDDLKFVNGSKDILWRSERSGWNHLFLIPRGGGTPRELTPGDFDVLGVHHVDMATGWVYYTASPDNPTQRYLYRVNFAKRMPVQRLTSANEPGSMDAAGRRSKGKSGSMRDRF